MTPRALQLERWRTVVASGEASAVCDRVVAEHHAKDGVPRRLLAALAHPRFHSPRPAELDVLACAAAGLTVEETAARRHTSRFVVAQQRKQAMDRLAARSMAHAVALCFARGLLTTDGVPWQ